VKDQQQLSASELCSLFFIFITGSNILSIPSQLIGFAQNGAWLSVLLSLVGGVGLLACVLFLYRKFPQMNLIEYSRQLVGKWITMILAVPFIFIQLNSTSGIILDVGVFMTTAMMRETPIYVFNLLTFVVVALTVRSGIEKISRMFTILMLTVILFIMVVVILASANYQPEYLVPVLPDGFKPVLLGTYFYFGVPITELILFAMLLPYVRRKENQLLKKGMFLALFVNHIFIIIVTISTIMIFGPVAGEMPYSMFAVARTIEMYEVIQRVELLMGYSLIITNYLKGVISLYILNITITYLFNIKDNRILVFPLALVCFLFSMLLISLGQAWRINYVTIIEPLWKAVSYVLPLLILMVAAVLRKNRESY
jgi:spore germination protein KB